MAVPSEKLSIDAIKNYVLRERLSMIVGVIVVVVAAGIGLLIGGAAVFAVVGVLVAAAALALMAWRNRGGRAAGSGLGGVLLNYGVATVAVLLLIQLVPFGRSHSNPPVTGEPAWATSETRDLMVDACFACHSNEVEWPWYSNIAPISWVVTIHVDEGREHVNYSEFDTRQHGADETIEVIREGSMPPYYFTAFGRHPEALLTDAQIQQLIAGLQATPGLSD